MSIHMKGKKAFTLLEILVVVAIITLLATAILVSVNQSKKNGRINSAKTSLKTVLTAIIGCRGAGGAVTARTANTAICNPPTGFAGANWPALENGYTYGVGTYNSDACNFQVNTNLDVTSLGNTYLTCDCVSQKCD